VSGPVAIWATLESAVHYGCHKIPALLAFHKVAFWDRAFGARVIPGKTREPIVSGDAFRPCRAPCARSASDALRLAQRIAGGRGAPRPAQTPP
jgi:hypothetical protein